MTQEDVWLKTIAELYGEDYARKLLEKLPQDKDRDEIEDTPDLPLES